MIKQIIILILFSSRLLSQSITDYAYTGYEATSLCGAVVANKGDNWSLYHNPSGIVEVDHIKVSFGYSKLYNQSFFPIVMLTLSYHQTNMEALDYLYRI